MKPGIAFKGGKTHTVRVMSYDRAMIDVIIRLVEISRKILAAFIQKRSGQDLHEFKASVSMSRQMKPGFAFQQHDLFIRASGNLDLAPLETWPQPLPWTDLAVLHGSWEFDSQFRVSGLCPLN